MHDTVWDTLAGQTGETFEFRPPDRAAVAAELVASERTEHGSAVTLTLTFRAEDGIGAQGTYEVAHPDMGTFELFVVPRSPTDFDAVITWVDAP